MGGHSVESGFKIALYVDDRDDVRTLEACVSLILAFLPHGEYLTAYDCTPPPFRASVEQLCCALGLSYRASGDWLIIRCGTSAEPIVALAQRVSSWTDALILGSAAEWADVPEQKRPVLARAFGVRDPFDWFRANRASAAVTASLGLPPSMGVEAYVRGTTLEAVLRLSGETIARLCGLRWRFEVSPE